MAYKNYNSRKPRLLKDFDRSVARVQRVLNPADDELFKREVEKTGSKCAVVDMGGSIGLTDE